MSKSVVLLHDVVLVLLFFCCIETICDRFRTYYVFFKDDPVPGVILSLKDFSCRFNTVGNTVVALDTLTDFILSEFNVYIPSRT